MEKKFIGLREVKPGDWVRRGLAAVAIVDLLLSGCTPQGAQTVPEVAVTVLTPTAVPQATLTPEVQIENLRSCAEEGEGPCDYCKVPEPKDTADEVEWITISAGDLETIRQLKLTQESLLYVGPNAKPEKDYVHHVIAGVGFENPDDLNQLLPYVENLNKVFQDLHNLPVRFYLLNVPVPIGMAIKPNSGALTFYNPAELELFLDKLNNIELSLNLSFILNSKEFFGLHVVTPYEFNITSMYESKTLLFLLHELGHSEGKFADRYPAVYELPTTELFLLDKNGDPILLPWIQRIYESVQPAIVFTGNFCGNKPVYAFYGNHGTPLNIMDFARYSNDEELLRMLTDKEAIYNEMQVQIMDGNVAAEIAENTGAIFACPIAVEDAFPESNYTIIETGDFSFSASPGPQISINFQPDDTVKASWEIVVYGSDTDPYLITGSEPLDTNNCFTAIGFTNDRNWVATPGYMIEFK